MRVKMPAIVFPLLALTACGGSQSSDQAAADNAGSAGETAPAASSAPAAVTAEASAPAPAQSASPQASAVAPAAFAICKSCHSVEQGKNGIGPSLAGIYGSKAGDVPGYSFSKALAASGIVWDGDKLDKWLQGPGKMVPGTKMVISVSDPEKRQAIIAYLKTLQ